MAKTTYSLRSSASGAVLQLVASITQVSYIGLQIGCFHKKRLQSPLLWSCIGAVSDPHCTGIGLGYGVECSYVYVHIFVHT